MAINWLPERNMREKGLCASASCGSGLLNGFKIVGNSAEFLFIYLFIASFSFSVYFPLCFFGFHPCTCR